MKTLFQLSLGSLLRLLPVASHRQAISGSCMGACGRRFHPPHQRRFVVGEVEGAATGEPATREYGRGSARGRRRRQPQATEEGLASRYMPGGGIRYVPRGGHVAR